MAHEHDLGFEDPHDFIDYDELEDLDEFDALDAAYFKQHEGELTGLTYEERERAIEEHMIAEDGHLSSRLVELLDSNCFACPPMTGLAELLALEDESDVRRFAGYAGFERKDLGGEELRRALAAHVGDAATIQPIIGELAEYHIVALRELAERGGRWDVPEAEVVSLRDLPAYEVGLCYAFHNGDTFTFIMPDEVLACAGAIDWDAALAKAREYRQLVGFFDDMVELRGIVNLVDVVEQYHRTYPDGVESPTEIVALLRRALMEGIAGFELLSTPERRVYVLHLELFWAYQEVMGLDDEPYRSNVTTEGELGEFLEDLLAQQQGIEPRELTREMLDARSLFDWKMRQEPVVAFCQYLDARVPAVRDDYYFADKVMEDLVSDAKWGLADQGSDRLFDILEANDFVPELEQVQEVLDLWVDLTSNLPDWPCNGWSPAELAARAVQEN